MDTKLKKSHKLTVLIIALCVMLPAICLVSLYPIMEKAMLEKREEYLKLEEEKAGDTTEWILAENFVNYAMESSYYAYANLLETAEGSGVQDQIFKDYGWDNDYFYAVENMTFIATYSPSEGVEQYVKQNVGELDTQVAKLVLEFDAHGKLMTADLTGEIEIDINGQDMTVYEIAERSTSQFQNNVLNYNSEYATPIDADFYVPKNFKMEIGLNDSSEFVWNYDEYYGTHGWYDKSVENLYWVTGAYWVIGIMIVFVLMVALVLPVIKRLDTGREKIFSLPFEIMVLVGGGAFFLTVYMGILMSHSTMWEIVNRFGDNLPEFLGVIITHELLYKFLLVGNFIGWSVCFFLVYMVGTAIHQMFSRTRYYVKYQILCIRVLRWLKHKFMVVYRYVTTIDIHEKLNKSILKIVIANFVILTILCCMWFFGVIGLVVYSIVLYVILQKEGEKTQKQYHSILNATQQMADGDLKISLEEDLGVFASIGESLEKVQQGFEKAVVEEAKSQNMKTELITNVSHDLKTPLTAIITYVDLLKKEDITDEDRRKYIVTLDQKSQRLKVLIDDLFEVSKAHSGNVKMNFMDVDVVSLLKQVRSEMDEQIRESQLQFRWNLPEEKIMLSLDGQRTYRVFENLLNNILKYAMHHTRAYVDLVSAEKEVKIVFRNISAMELDYDVERLTDRFVRGDSARNSEGSGLGLAIVKSFVELQNGTFHVEGDGDLFKAIICFVK